MSEAGLAATKPAACVIGAAGGLGAALADVLEATGMHNVIRLARPDIDVTSEDSVAAAAGRIAAQPAQLRHVIVATGFLHDAQHLPERSLRDISADHLMKAFAINATGPALVMKHFLPLLPRSGRSVFAALSARVGSIGDNRLGGWYSYRASKAALNQLVRTASVELRRTRPEAICVAVHPGTAITRLSEPFSKTGLDPQPAGIAAARIVAAIAALGPAQSGSFIDYRGEALPW